MKTKALAAEFIGTFMLMSSVLGAAFYSFGAPGGAAGILGVALSIGLTVMALARSIGHEPADPTVEELALAEIGWSIGGVTWRGSESPIADADLQSADLSELPARIKAWTPKSAGEEADLRWLSDAMQRVAAKDPERGISIALALI